MSTPLDSEKSPSNSALSSSIKEEDALNYYVIGLMALVFFLVTLLCLDGLEIEYLKPFEVHKEEVIIEEENPIYIRIGVVGDIMTHEPQLRAQTLADGGFDFRDNYRWMRSLFARTDIMIGNLETTLSGADRKFTGYPMFNSPDALAAALSDAFFNVIITANNHMYDRGGNGMRRTLEQLKAHGLTSVGTRMDTSESPFIIKIVDGIKVGITAFSYESPKRTDHKFINGIRVRNEHRDWMNTFDPTQPEIALSEISDVVDQMRANGAELLIVALHWGYEYQESPNSFQKSLADGLHKHGVDIILGSHPHVVQHVEWWIDSVTGHQTVVAFSFGNFISNQRFESNQKYPTEDGLYLEFLIERIGPSSRPMIKSVLFEPTWVHRYTEEGKYKYEVLPTSFVKQEWIAPPNLSGATLDRIRQSYARTAAKMRFNPLMDSSDLLNRLRPYEWIE